MLPNAFKMKKNMRNIQDHKGFKANEVEPVSVNF